MKMTTAQKAWSKWREKLSLQAWRVALEEEDVEYLDEDREQKTLANCARHYPTLRAVLTVATRQPREEIEASVLHEALHILLGELYDWAYDATEGMSRELQREMRARFDGIEERIVRRLERILLGEESEA